MGGGRPAGGCPSSAETPGAVETIVAELLNIGGRYHRYLHQDEFGPTRAERMAALREILDRLEKLGAQLGDVPACLRFALSENQCVSVAERPGSASLLSMKAEAVDPFASIRAGLDRLRHRFEAALSGFEHRKGPEPRLSLGLLVCQLCDLWCRETGKPITANPVWQGVYIGRPQSAAGGCGGASTAPVLDTG
jgi:hypothetical protein